MAENYIFMTLLQILNMSFYLLIYPFLIRTLGIDAYGLYAYATAIVSLCITIVNFGFDLPSAKRVAENVGDKVYLGKILTEVTAAKLVIEAILTPIFTILLCLIPILSSNRIVFGLMYIQTVTAILFPQWYFLGVQRMRIVTYIQFGFKILSLPFLLFLLHTADDINLFAGIITAASVLGGIAAWALIRYQDGILLERVTIGDILTTTRNAGPFFLSNIAGIIKEQGIVLLTGAFLSMSEVAFYDLANKIVLIPRTIFSKLNDAIYPQYVVQCKPAKTHRLLLAETALGLSVIASIALFGKPAVLLLGGTEMMSSYGISILLSITVLTWMIAGIYIYFGIIPSGQNKWITINQLVAMVVALSTAGIGLYFYHSVYVLAASIAISGLGEIAFLAYITHKYKLI